MTKCNDGVVVLFLFRVLKLQVGDSRKEGWNGVLWKGSSFPSDVLVSWFLFLEEDGWVYHRGGPLLSSVVGFILVIPRFFIFHSYYNA